MALTISTECMCNQVFLKNDSIPFRYLYCDEISLKADNVLSTLYAAKKYIMPHLEHACVEYLKKNVSASNACKLLSDCRLFEETAAMQRYWGVIDNQTTKALQSDSFPDIDYQTLEEILSRDTLNVEETVVFNAAKRWAEAECSRQGRDANSQNCREVLGDALYLLRFSTMTLDEFANGPGQSGLLNTQEINDIFFYHTARNKPKLRFPTARRKVHENNTAQTPCGNVPINGFGNRGHPAFPAGFPANNLFGHMHAPANIQRNHVMDGDPLWWVTLIRDAPGRSREEQVLSHPLQWAPCNGDDSGFAPGQWETVLHCNDVSHCLQGCTPTWPSINPVYA